MSKRGVGEYREVVSMRSVQCLRAAVYLCVSACVGDCANELRVEHPHKSLSETATHIHTHTSKNTHTHKNTQPFQHPLTAVHGTNNTHARTHTHTHPHAFVQSPIQQMKCSSRRRRVQPTPVRPLPHPSDTVHTGRRLNRVHTAPARPSPAPRRTCGMHKPRNGTVRRRRIGQ